MPWLARISHHPPAAARDLPASTALRSGRVLPEWADGFTRDRELWASKQSGEAYRRMAWIIAADAAVRAAAGGW